MKATLSDLVDNCVGDHRSSCPILERLSAADSGRLAVAMAAPGSIKTLKQVRAGSVREKRNQNPQAQELPAHAALMAWGRSFASAAA